MTKQDLQPFLTPKHFGSSFELAGLQFEVYLETPDLSDCPRSMWADWGPMYTFDLGEAGAFRVTYRCHSRATSSQHDVPVESVQLLSPISWARRQRHPLYLELTDHARARNFAVHLDKDGDPASLEVSPMREETEVSALLLHIPSVRRIVHRQVA